VIVQLVALAEHHQIAGVVDVVAAIIVVVVIIIYVVVVRHRLQIGRLLVLPILDVVQLFV